MTVIVIIMTVDDHCGDVCYEMSSHQCVLVIVDPS